MLHDIMYERYRPVMNATGHYDLMLQYNMIVSLVGHLFQAVPTRHFQRYAGLHSALHTYKTWKWFIEYICPVAFDTHSTNIHYPVL